MIEEGDAVEKARKLMRQQADRSVIAFSVALCASPAEPDRMIGWHNPPYHIGCLTEWFPS
ncbi:MAG: hypothetical protein AMXMBFR13_18000 [Phycisphaerae bacterium]